MVTAGHTGPSRENESGCGLGGGLDRDFLYNGRFL